MKDRGGSNDRRSETQMMSGLERRPRLELIGVAAISLAAFGVRLAYHRTAWLLDFFNSLSDTGLHNMWAQNILKSGASLAMVAKGILYPWFVSLGYRLLGPVPERILLVQLLIDTVSVFLVYALGKRLFGRGAGIIGAVLYGLFGPAVFYSNLLLVETLLACLVILALFAVETGRQAERPVYVLAGGVVLGIACLGRGNILIPGFVLAAVMLFQKKYSLTALLVLGMIGPLVFNGVRTRLLYKDWIITQASSGLNLYIGNNEQAKGYYIAPGGMDLTTDFSGEAVVTRALGRSVRPSTVSSFYTMKAWDFIRQNPGRAILLVLKKAFLFWNDYEIPQFENFYYARQNSLILKLLPVTFGFFAVLGSIGLVVSLGAGRPPGPACFVIGYFISLIPFFVVGRFRQPIAPVLAVLSGYAVVWLANEIRVKARRGLALGAVGLGLAVLTTVPLVDRTRFDIQSAADHGLWHLYNGRFDEARRLLDGLVGRHSGASIGYNSLGQVVMRQGEVLKAVDLFVKAGKIDPQEGAYHINLGGAYYALGQTEAAIREFEAGKARAPLNVRVDRFLDWAYELQKMERTDRFGYCMTVAQNLVFFRDYATAIGFLVQAKELRPDSKDPLHALQSVYYRMGDKKQVLETMYESLKRFPDETSDLKGMGMLYHELGVPDSARLYLEAYLKRVPADAQAQTILQMLPVRE